jgi:hypothetical protein
VDDESTTERSAAPATDAEELLGYDTNFHDTLIIGTGTTSPLSIFVFSIFVIGERTALVFVIVAIITTLAAASYTEY